jgi:hypothetical protein
MLKFIHGKPGSGKSCYVVALIYAMLLDWARYKIKHGETYPRILFTNIPLNIDTINEALSKELCTEIDLSDQIELLDDSFFFDKHGEYRDWWTDFPDKAYLVIDEVHHYLPSSVKRQSQGQRYADKFTQFVSTHRHKQMDVILMSQHIDKVSSEAKKDIQEIFEVLNVKSTKIGIFPFTVPMEDVDVVREAWGFPVQMAHIKRGVMEAKKVRYDKNFDVFILTPFLFRLYRSHTMSDEAFDRPSLRLGRIGSLVWFARRHVVRLGFWTIMAVCGLMGIRNVMSELPNALVKSMIPPAPKPTVSTTISPTSPLGMAMSGSLPMEHVHGPGCNHSAETAPVPAVPADDEIIGFVKGGVITRKGVLRKDDHLIVDGEKDFVSSVDVGRRTLYLGAGKKVQK